MAVALNQSFYLSARWKKCRASYIAYRQGIDGGMCERCHREPGFIVHHKTYLDSINVHDDTIALAFENLEYVCHDCHNTEHFGKTPELLCAFDEKGFPIDATAAERNKNQN